MELSLSNGAAVQVCAQKSGLPKPFLGHRVCIQKSGMVCGQCRHVSTFRWSIYSLLLEHKFKLV